MIKALRVTAGEEAGRRIFFRREDAEQHSSADEVYDATYANLLLTDCSEPRQVVRQIRRVTRPAATVAVTLRGVGSFDTILDQLHAGLERAGIDEVAPRLERVRRHFPSVETATTLFERMGFTDFETDTLPVTMPFQSLRDMLRSPAARFFVISQWLEWAGLEEELERVIALLDRDKNLGESTEADVNVIGLRCTAPGKET